MSAWQFATSIGLGILSVIIPLAAFVGTVALCVFVARWWMARSKT